MAGLNTPESQENLPQQETKESRKKASLKEAKYELSKQALEASFGLLETLNKGKQKKNYPKKVLEKKVKESLVSEIENKLYEIDRNLYEWSPPDIRDKLGNLLDYLYSANNAKIDIKKYIKEYNRIETKNNKRDGYPNGTPLILE